MAASGESRSLDSAAEMALRAVPVPETETEIAERTAGSVHRLCLGAGGCWTAGCARVLRVQGVGSASVVEKLDNPALDFVRRGFVARETRRASRGPERELGVSAHMGERSVDPPS